MRLKVVHETVYKFSEEVFFEPHHLRFKPKSTLFIEPEMFELQISPQPAGLSEHMDPENNKVHLAWFDGMHPQMKIKAEFRINSIDYNPFNFILYPDKYLTLPFQYDENLVEILQPALKIEPIGPELLEYAKTLMDASKGETIHFLLNLTKQIHSDFKLETREMGEPYPPNKTFNVKNGSCRDLTWMMIQVLRNMGIAARFVSGYFHITLDKPEFELHAWPEVFLPGAGWIGYDPSHGIAVGNTHIPIASSAKPEYTMPVSGSIRGDATSTLNTSLTIETLD